MFIHSCRFSTLDKFCAFHIKLVFVFGMILILNGKTEDISCILSYTCVLKSQNTQIKDLISSPVALLQHFKLYL